MNPSLQRPCRLLRQSFSLPLQTRSSSYSLCKQGRWRSDRSDRWCPRAILIALLFCWRNTDVAFHSSWSLQPGYCSGSHQLLLFPRYPPPKKKPTSAQEQRENWLPGLTEPVTFGRRPLEPWLTQALRHCDHLGPRIQGKERTPYPLWDHIISMPQKYGRFMGMADCVKVWSRKE